MVILLTHCFLVRIMVQFAQLAFMKYKCPPKKNPIVHNHHPHCMCVYVCTHGRVYLNTGPRGLHGLPGAPGDQGPVAKGEKGEPGAPGKGLDIGYSTILKVLSNWTCQYINRIILKNSFNFSY